MFGSYVRWTYAIRWQELNAVLLCCIIGRLPRTKLPPHRAQVCAAVGLCQPAAGTTANASIAMAATARKLLAGAGAGARAGALGDPSPFCQFCTVAISYIKARRSPLRGPVQRFSGR